MNESRSPADVENALEGAERELLRRDLLFRAVVENTPDLIARFDRDLRRVYVNPAIERLTGVPADALTGKTMSEMNFDPRFSGQIEAALAQVFREGTETTLEVLLRSSGEERVFQARVVPERGESGTVDFALIISRDITDIRRDQERLTVLTREVELLLASTYEGICATDLAGQCTLVNASAASMLGYTPSEMMGRSFHEIVHDAHAAGSPCRTGDCSVMKAVAGRKPTHVVHEVLRRKDGTSFPVEMFFSPVEGDDHAPKGMVASFIGVAERERLQAELEQANRLVGLGRVATAMSHEFNNLLMGIQPFAEVLRRSSQEPRLIEAADRIIQSVQRGRGITEGVRAFTRAEPPVRVPIDVPAWLSRNAGELASLLPADVRFTLDVVDEDLCVEADPAQVRQVLQNLFLNALDALGGEPGAVRLAVQRADLPGHAGPAQAFIRFSVTDDGSGIDQRNLARVFEPFYSTKKTGKGLGLAIAQQIATLHGGALILESALHAGTTAHFFLPEAGARSVAAEDRKPEPGPRWPASILLVEDDVQVASGVMMLLEDEAVTVRLAPDGGAALKVLESYRPQALVIDVNLPDCNGFDLFEQITAAHGPLPVVFASGHADAARLAGLESAGNVRMLAKPYAIETLLELLSGMAP